jgi:hypothetical protein
MAATVTLGDNTFDQGRASNTVDLPYGGTHIPDYVAILQGLALNLGNPPDTDLDVTFPQTAVVDLGEKVGDFWVNSLIVVALRRGVPDVDLASPDTYTLVKVSSDSSSVTQTVRLWEASSFQLNQSLFCSLVAANPPRLSDARSIQIALHLGITTEMRAQRWRAENPGHEDTVHLKVMDVEFNSEVDFRVKRCCSIWRKCSHCTAQAKAYVPGARGARVGAERGGRGARGARRGPRTLGWWLSVWGCATVFGES